MTVVTISTVGYSEIQLLPTAGRIFAIILILGRVCTVFYILTSLVRYILEGELGFRMWRQRMEAKIKKLHGHFIICGFVKIGNAIADTLATQRTT